MRVQDVLFNPIQAQAVMLKAAIEMSRESQSLMIDAIKRAGKTTTSPVTWVTFEVPMLDPRTFINEDMMRGTFHRMADRNLRGWEVAADMLKTMPNWMNMSAKVPGTVLTDWFDQMRRSTASMMPANDAWATSDRTMPTEPKRETKPAARPAQLTASKSVTDAKPKAAATKSVPTKAASAKSEVPAAKAPRAKPSRPAAPKPAGPQRLDAPRGKADDLTAIKGIGEKLASLLNTLGIYHYDQIAGWSAADGEWIDSKLAFKGRVARENWVAQAKALVKKAA